MRHFSARLAGTTSARTTFAAAVETVRASVAHLPQIRAAVAAVADEDVAENTARQMLENGLVKLVASFQRLAEATFRQAPVLPASGSERTFSKTWTSQRRCGKTPRGPDTKTWFRRRSWPTWCSTFSSGTCSRHRDGIVDQEYLDKSGDRTYSVGQWLVVKEPAVSRLAEVVSRLSKGLEGLAP